MIDLLCMMIPKGFDRVTGSCQCRTRGIDRLPVCIPEKRNPGMEQTRGIPCCQLEDGIPGC